MKSVFAIITTLIASNNHILKDLFVMVLAAMANVSGAVLRI